MDLILKGLMRGIEIDRNNSVYIMWLAFVRTAHLYHHLNANLNYMEEGSPQENNIDCKPKYNLVKLTISVILAFFFFKPILSVLALPM